MNKIANAFKSGKALITYITGGDPDLEMTVRLIPELEQAGVDIIEIGIPFSDPLADGPTIQAASQRALQEGVTLSAIINKLEEIKGEINVPLILMGYYNSILNYGRKKFVSEIKNAGISGVIIPDLPWDEDQEFYRLLSAKGVAGILLVTPNTSEERLKQIAVKSTGFLYCVSLLGVTGDNRGLYNQLGDYLQRVRKYVPELPLALGFGISCPDQIQKLIDSVDGVIIGSALINQITSGDSQVEMLYRARGFIGDIKQVMA